MDKSIGYSITMYLYKEEDCIKVVKIYERDIGTNKFKEYETNQSNKLHSQLYKSQFFYTYYFSVLCDVGVIKKGYKLDFTIPHHREINLLMEYILLYHICRMLIHRLNIFIFSLFMKINILANTVEGILIKFP